MEHVCPWLGSKKSNIHQKPLFATFSNKKTSFLMIISLDGVPVKRFCHCQRNSLAISSSSRVTKSSFLFPEVSDYEDTLNKPHAVPIILANDNHTFKLDEEALRRVLLRDELKDRYAVVVSVAGAFRHGKSFLLDFFLRYLSSKVSHCSLSHSISTLHTTNALIQRCFTQ